MKRRRLNDFQRTELALKAKPILEEIAEENQKAGVGQIFDQGMRRVNNEIGKRPPDLKKAQIQPLLDQTRRTTN